MLHFIKGNWEQIQFMTLVSDGVKFYVSGILSGVSRSRSKALRQIQRKCPI
jgi:hypothetical protein